LKGQRARTPAIDRPLVIRCGARLGTTASEPRPTPSPHRDANAQYPIFQSTDHMQRAGGEPVWSARRRPRLDVGSPPLRAIRPTHPAAGTL